MKLSERIERTEPKDRAPARKAVRTADGWGRRKREAREALLAAVGPELHRANTPEELHKLVSSNLDDVLKRAGLSVSGTHRTRFVREVAADLLGYGPLDPLLADPAVTEIMCNGPHDIWIERAGRLEHTEARFIDGDHLRQIIEKIVATVGRRIDDSSPMVDARLPDGSRVNAVVPPVSVHWPALTIRRFPEDPYTVSDLVTFGTLTVEAAAFLECCVRGKLNVLISGGTGTGKTTMLNVLSSFAGAGERIVTIEDAAELRLGQPHVVTLEARPANTEGAGEITIRDLVRNALRMRPDRIVVGEVRGAEALDMLQAMNTGHEGSLTTVHCNSPRDALSRLETMVLMAGYDLPVRAIRSQIASALDVIVHLDRFGDGSRRVTSVAEIQGMEGDVITLQDVYRFDLSEGGRETARASGRLRGSGLRPRVVDKLTEAGVEVAPKLYRGR